MSDKETGKRSASVINRPWVPDLKSTRGRKVRVELSSLEHRKGNQSTAAPSGLLIFTAHCGEYPMRVLLDSGAQSNFISAAAARKASLHMRRPETPLYVRHSNGVEMEVTAEVQDIELVFQQSSIL